MARQRQGNLNTTTGSVNMILIGVVNPTSITDVKELRSMDKTKSIKSSIDWDGNIADSIDCMMNIVHSY